MKNIIFTLCISMLCIQIIAQAPQAFNYQGVARDLSGNPISNQDFGIEIAILQGTTTGSPVFIETHFVRTNDSGLFALQIGNGDAVNNSFDEIAWENGSHFLQVSMDENGGSNFQLIGTSQLISVPYALYAERSGDAIWNQNDKGIDYNDGNVGLGTDAPENKLEITLENAGNLLGQGLEINRNDGYLKLTNGTGFNGEFQARISGLADSDISPGLTLVGTPSLINTSARGIVLRAGETTPMSNGNLLEVDNFTSTQMVLNHEGHLGIGTDAPKNTVDINLESGGNLLGQGLEINRNDGYLKLTNGTGFNGDFQARISGLADSDISPGLILVGTPSVSDETARGIVLRAGETTPMSNGNLLEVDNFTSTQMVLNHEGHLGIGTDAPKNTVDINLESGGNLLGQGLEINRNDGYLKLTNGTGFNGDFQARISGLADSDISPGLILVGTPSVSDETARGIVLRAGETTPMSNGNLLEVDNFTTTQMVLNHEGQLGIGTESPKAKLQVSDGDVYIEDISKGVIMKSPNGQCWRYTPDNQGALSPTAVDCPN